MTSTAEMAQRSSLRQARPALAVAGQAAPASAAVGDQEAGV